METSFLSSELELAGNFRTHSFPVSPATEHTAVTLLPWLLPPSGLQRGVCLGLVESYKHTPLALLTSSFASTPCLLQALELLSVRLTPTWSCYSPALKSTEVKD